MHGQDVSEDARRWVQRWDRVLGDFVHQRERTFALVFDVIERLVGTPSTVLDLGSGPGSLAIRTADKWPDADVVALDVDPVLLELGRRAHGDRIRWVDADLRRPDWHEPLGPVAFDAVLSATALHYLGAATLPSVYGGVADCLRPGGAFVDCDTMPLDSSNPRLAALAAALREESWQRAGADGEGFGEWWRALEVEPGWDELFAERTRRFGGAPLPQESTVAERTAALRGAGFAEVDTIAQGIDTRVLVALAPE